MAIVNRVLLLGVVAAQPRHRSGGCELVVAVPEERAGRAWLERITLVVKGQTALEALELRPAQPVHAEGYLSRAPTGGAVVVVHRLFALGEPPPPITSARTSIGSHAPPHPHERAGHPRRIHIGQPDEHLIWVRPAHVGGQGSPPSSNAARFCAPVSSSTPPAPPSSRSSSMAGPSHGQSSHIVVRCSTACCHPDTDLH